MSGAQTAPGSVEPPSGVFAARPWASVWGDVAGFHRPGDAASLLALFDTALQAEPDRALISYFDRTWSVQQVADEVSALAAYFQESAIGSGDRVGLYVQNMPEFIVGAIAAWRVGATVVPINPMYRERELGHILTDSGLTAVLALDELLPIVAAARAGAPLRVVISTNGRRALSPDHPVPAVLAGTPLTADTTEGDAVAYADILDRFDGAVVTSYPLGSEDIAFIAYTSGTTGTPKGAMLSHGSAVFSARTFASMRELGADDVIFAMAPLFHVTGLICTLALGLMLPARMVLGYRFEVATALSLIERYRVTFTVGATTVFIAFLDSPAFADHDISSLTKIVCGGAPIPPSVVERYEAATGVYLHNGYGMTETTSPTFGTPLGSRSPVSPVSGSLALGVPVPDTDCRLVGDDGAEVGLDEPGEIVVRGPHVMSGYWNNAAETASAFTDGWLRTGDVATMDTSGWFYLVDRKKDQINASGFKVWPQEVEEVLYEHPAVREAGVIGVPDEYRGETVKAFVSLRDGAAVEPAELIEFCRTHLAAFKVPRVVQVLDELPKTVTGKITRRSLRDLEHVGA